MCPPGPSRLRRPPASWAAVRNPPAPPPAAVTETATQPRRRKTTMLPRAMATNPPSPRPPGRVTMTNATVIKSDPVEIGDRLYRERRFESAAESYSMAAARLETVPSDLCLKLAHCYQKLKDYPAALRWALATVENDDYAAWQGAAQI